MPVIPSVPATFNVAAGGTGFFDVTFAIPAGGPFTLGIPAWSWTGTVSGLTVSNQADFETVPGSGHTVADGAITANGAASGSVAGIGTQQGDINSHRGGNLTVRFSLLTFDATMVLAVSSFTLTIVGPTGQIVIPGTVGLFDFCKVGILCLEDMQVLEKLVLQQTISGYTAPFGFQIARSDFAGYLEFLPGFVMLNAAAGNLSLGIRVYKGKSAPDNAWHQGINTQVGNPDAIFGAWYPALVPWNDLLNLYVEFFYPIAASIPANSTLEMTIRPFN